MSDNWHEIAWLAVKHKIDRNSRRNRQLRKICAFLDMDGVVNVFYPEGTPEYAYRLEHRDDEMCMADKPGVKRLSDLFLEYGIDVVISSSWRYDGIAFCRSYLEKAGMDPTVHVVGATPCKQEGTREMHIAEYLLDHPDYAQYLIFDDMAMPHLRKHLLQCDCTQGYTEELDHRARTLLKGYQK